MKHLSNLYGFDGIGELLYTALGMKYAKAVFFASIITGVIGYFTNFFNQNFEPILCLYFLMGIDLITGTTKAIMNKQFSSRKFMRIWILLIFNSILIFVSWMLARNNFLFHYLPSIVMGGLYGTYLISFIENAGELGWLPPGITKIIKNRFGFKALNAKFNNMGDSQ